MNVYDWILAMWYKMLEACVAKSLMVEYWLCDVEMMEAHVVVEIYYGWILAMWYIKCWKPVESKSFVGWILAICYM